MADNDSSRGPGGKFKPGHPGGPGRPKGSQAYVARCKKWADEKGFDLLERIAAGVEPGFEGEPGLRLHAAEYLVNRGYGKPKESVDHSSDDGTLANWIASAAERPDEPVPGAEAPAHEEGGA